MNKIDKQYQTLLQTILDYGIQKKDRTGTGTKSIFGYTIRHKMSEGFPLLTTKKMAWKTMVTELLWFLRGDTNIKFLLDYDCHIWDGDAFKNFMDKSVGDPDLIWNQDQFINKIKTDDEFAKEWGELGPIYGKQWRNWNGKPEQITNYGGGEINPYFCDCQELFEDGHSKVRKKNKGIDQIANLINELKTNPDSRRLMVSAWNPSDLPNMVLPPCHYGFQVYTRELNGEERWDLLKKKVGEEKFKIMVDEIVPFGGGLSEELQSYNIPRRTISLMWNQRSVDTFLGLPFNIASYGLLLEIIAKEVNMVPEDLIGNLGDVHLYLNHIEQSKEQIGRTPYELPKVEITERNWYIHESVKEHLGDKTFNDKILSYRPDCFELINYQSHSKIKAPLSN